MTVKQKVGWKVVSHYRCSTIMCSTPAGRFYKKRRKVTPVKDYGPLCVFMTKVAARRFSRRCANTNIVKCLYKPSKLEEIWDGRDSISLESLPLGTTLADSITCLE